MAKTLAEANTLANAMVAWVSDPDQGERQIVGKTFVKTRSSEQTIAVLNDVQRLCRIINNRSCPICPEHVLALNVYVSRTAPDRGLPKWALDIYEDLVKTRRENRKPNLKKSRVSC